MSLLGRFLVGRKAGGNGTAAASDDGGVGAAAVDRKSCTFPWYLTIFFVKISGESWGDWEAAVVVADAASIKLLPFSSLSRHNNKFFSHCTTSM